MYDLKIHTRMREFSMTIALPMHLHIFIVFMWRPNKQKSAYYVKYCDVVFSDSSLEFRENLGKVCFHETNF